MDPRADGGGRAFLRHTLATMAYRGGKVVRGAPADFASFRIGGTTRTPVEILAHIGDLLDWSLTIAKGDIRYKEATPLPWDAEVARFCESLARLDRFLESEEALAHPAEKIFQGPIADALTHFGQISIMRRLAGSPVRGENYFMAEIVAGRIGPEQAAPRREFD